MLKTFSLKYKVIIHILLLLFASLLIVGVTIDYQLRNIFHEDAREQLHDAFFDVSTQMKYIERGIWENVEAVASNEMLAASMKMINTYQDIQNYNAILFDEEKKRIIGILANEVGSTFNDHVAVYDDQARLVAFAGNRNGHAEQGYVSYESGVAVLYVRATPALPFIRASGVHVPDIHTYRSGKTTMHYTTDANRLKLVGDKNIMAAGKPVGYVLADKVITHDMLHAMTDDRNTHVDYALSSHPASEEEYRSLPMLFAPFELDAIELVETEDHFHSTVRFDLDNEQAYMTARVDKSLVNSALEKSRRTLVLILVAVSATIFLISVIFVNSVISTPLRKLMAGIEVLRNRQYEKKVYIDTNDEMGLIAKRFNEMAETVYLREMALDKLAYHDVLTKMPNRAMFHERLEEALGRAGRLDNKVAVLFFDLDQFKGINDTLGHDVGDKLLIDVAERLSTIIRKNDLLARIGGDEFTILIEDMESPVIVEEIARKVVDRMKIPFHIEDEQLQVSCSIGITIFPDDGEDPNTLMKHADLAMYQAKELGRDQYHFFSSALSKSLKERTAMLKALRGSLPNNELQLYYQPKFSLERNVVQGAEALLRWESREFGFVTPDRFIPLCEESGLIVQFGRWVLRRACEDFIKWRELGLPIKHISVNVSNVQFLRSNMVDTVQEVLAQTGVEPGALELEITESYIHGDSENAMRVLHEIREIGVGLAIDDFGTGYSSMSYLKLLPLTRLKIDRSFIMDIPHDPNDMEITRAIVALAGVLGLEVTAEGVETVEQMDFLKGLKCDEGQGYLCSKPLDFEAFVALIQDGLSCRGNEDA